jgi:Secretion system C-terminal sorting domain
MKKLLLIAFTFLGLKVFAQPTFTAADLNPLVGDVTSFITLDTTGIAEGTAGANQIWNFNVVISNTPINSLAVNPSTAPAAGFFPTATVALQTNTINQGNSVYAFLNADNAKQELLGQVVNTGTTIDTSVFSDPLIQTVYPLTFQTSYYDIGIVPPKPSSPLPNTTTYGLQFDADAYGTLVINNQTFTNVLRIKAIDTLTLDFGFFQFEQIVTSYSWLKQGYKSAIFGISYSEASGTISKSVTINGNLPTSLWNAIVDAQVSVFPNPAINQLNITNGFKGTTTYEIKDVNGKVIEVDQLNSISKTIDIKALSEGMYILELKSNDKILTKKFVKR